VPFDWSFVRELEKQLAEEEEKKKQKEAEPQPEEE